MINCDVDKNDNGKRDYINKTYIEQEVDTETKI